MFPNASSSDLPALEKVFSMAWEAAIIEVVIVLTGEVCHVYTYTPIHDHDHSRRHCQDLTPVLIASWTRNSTTDNSKETFFADEKISNLHLCVVQVLIQREVSVTWRPILEFLKVAMNATFNITVTPTHPDYSRLHPSEIQVTPVLVHDLMAVYSVIPSYLFYEENVFAVPRVPTSSFHSSPLFSEWSDSVWYALMVTLVAMVGVSCLFMEGDKDLVFVILFVLQPLLVAPQSGNFLSWRGRIFFTYWLIFCFILQSSYLCTFLSQLTVPSTADALNSLDDLLETVLPVHVGLQLKAVNLPFQSAQSQALMRKVYQYKGSGGFFSMIQNNRCDVAYTVPKYLFPALFLNMPYRVLPGASINVAIAPFRLNKPSPYGRFFEIAFMRAMGAGAFDKVWRNRRIAEFLYFRALGGDSSESLKRRVPQPLSLSSFRVLLGAWCLGCIFGFASFVIEVCLNCKIERISVFVPRDTRRITYRR